MQFKLSCFCCQNILRCCEKNRLQYFRKLSENKWQDLTNRKNNYDFMSKWVSVEQALTLKRFFCFKSIFGMSVSVYVRVCVCVWGCVCVWEREKKRERERGMNSCHKVWKHVERKSPPTTDRSFFPGALSWFLETFENGILNTVCSATIICKH